MKKDRTAAPLARLEELRAAARAGANAERLGGFTCRGCVAWCCRAPHNSMRATPLEAEAIARELRRRGPEAVEAARRDCARAVERFGLDAPVPEDAPPRPYTCPFLTAQNLCGVHEVKPVGCITFTPVADGGCDQDGAVLEEILADLGEANDEALGGREWTGLPLPIAVLAALEAPDGRDRPGGRRDAV
jgi:Fe-S-cluster containining protein